MGKVGSGRWGERGEERGVRREGRRQDLDLFVIRPLTLHFYKSGTELSPDQGGNVSFLEEIFLP